MAGEFEAEPRHSARLRIRPGSRMRPGLPPGISRLGLRRQRDGLIRVPTATGPRPVPLVVLLHGAGAGASDVVELLAEPAERHGVAVLAPESWARTWDLVRGSSGPDAEFIELALNHVMARLRIDCARVALAGFSDGASYALSLGIANGDLLTDLIAFSPGFAAPAGRIGRPRIFVSHGVHDLVLPIDRCSRRIVPRLRRAGYDITYAEFDGGHLVPPEIASRAIAWL